MKTREDNGQVEFLDVLHQSCRKSRIKFIITDYVKPTAKYSTFLNGRSFHPAHIFKGIIFGEAKRLRRLNETDEGYTKSLERLKQKCLHSRFNKKIVKESFEKIKFYKNLWEKNQEETIMEKQTKRESEKKKGFIPWASSIKQLMNLNKKEKQLIPNSQIIYSRPNTLGKILTNYKRISLGENKTVNDEGSSKGCQRCSLCGNFGNHKSMIEETKVITTKTNTKIKLKQDLICKNYGIYAAQCLICFEIYVGQTINPFHERWNGHRQDWETALKKWELR